MNQTDPTADLRDEKIPSRFWEKVDKTDGCWTWTGTIDSHGYGQIWINKRRYAAHRLSYLLAHGEIPSGLVIDHVCHGLDENCTAEGGLCRHRSCVNPDHLEAVTHQVNLLRGHGASGKAARRTHCPQGHPYDEANTLMEGKTRRCRACRKAREAATRTVLPPAERTHCPQGHPYSEENTYIRPNGSRCCRACGREKSRYKRKDGSVRRRVSAEARRLAMSEALGLGTGAPWEAILERAAELFGAQQQPQTEVAAARAAVLGEQADRAAVARVRGLHRKATHGDDCVHCAAFGPGYDNTWPCQTIRALDGTLPEAELRRLAVEAHDTGTQQPEADVVEAHRLALSEALHLGNAAPWDAILDRAGELSRRDVEAQQQPDTEAQLASLAVNAANALRDEKRHYEIACQENARLRNTIDRVRALHDSLEATSELTSPDDSITRGAAAKRIAAALDGWTPPAPVAQQPAALRAELTPFQLLADQPDEPLPQTERVIGGRRLGTSEQQAAAADGEEPWFGMDGCTCKPWTSEGGKRRFMEPGETVDRVSGWHVLATCPHHGPRP